jgi:hypothetical protein
MCDLTNPSSCSMDPTTSPAVTVSASSAFQAGRRRLAQPVWKQRYCGYILDREWYTAQAQARFGSPNERSTFNQRTRFIYSLLNESGLRGHSRLRNVKVEGGSRLCITLASNSSKREMELPPQENVDKLKALLGTDEPPKWYLYDG